MGGHEEDRARMRQQAASLEAALGWLPVASLLLTTDVSALAVNPAWAALSGISAQDSLGHGWLDAVVPPERGMLGARLRLAAALGERGTADCHVSGSAGARTTRWWWQPGPAGGLVVCAAATGDGDAAPVALASRMTADLASAVLHRLFRVGLLLQPALDENDHPAAARLGRAADELDELIRDIQDTVFGERPTSPGP